METLNRHQLSTVDLANSAFTNILASSTKGTGKKLALCSTVHDSNNINTNIHVLSNTNGNSGYNVTVNYVGIDLAEAINKYNSLP